jgi:pyridoxine 5-phosphate synthase
LIPELIVKLDHIATLRKNSLTGEPDPVAGAILAELAGANGIAVHLYEERLHIQDRDVSLLRQIVQTRLILNMAPSPQMVGTALNLRPDSVTLVPEKKKYFSTGGGLDLIVHETTIAETVQSLQAEGIPVGIRIAPEPEQIKIAHRIDATLVEFQMTLPEHKTTSRGQRKIFGEMIDAIKLAHKLKRRIAVGKNLSYQNIQPFLKLPEIDEYRMGHSIVARALMVGMEKAVREMRQCICEGCMFN